MTDDRPTPCSCVHLFTRSYASNVLMSLELVFHLIFGRLLLIFPGISVINTFLCTRVCVVHLTTCPYQFNLLSVIVLEDCATLVIHRVCPFLLLEGYYCASPISIAAV